MLHEQGLVLVHGEPGVALDAGERDVHPALLEPGSVQEHVDPLDEPELRVEEVHGVEGVAGHRDRKGAAGHQVFLVVRHDRGLALATLGAVHAIQIDEVDGRGRIVAVGHAVPHPGADERQVRVTVARLDLLLLRRQLAPKLHLVVVVRGVRGKEGVEGVEELREPPVVVMHPGREALVEIARGRVKGAVERLAVTPQQVAGVRRDLLVDVDRFEAAAGAQGEPDLSGHGSHSAELYY